MENNNSNMDEQYLEETKKIKKEGKIRKSYNWYSERKQDKKDRISSMTKTQKIKYYTKDLFINSSLAFVYDFFLRVLFQWLFLNGKFPTSIPGYFYDFLFVKYGVYYTVIWFISALAFFTYLGKKRKNIKLFYYSWFSLLIICLSQILMDFHVYASFVKLIFKLEFMKIFNLFRYHSFQVELFVLFWSIQNIIRFTYVSRNMANIKIEIKEIEDEDDITDNKVSP